MDSWDEELITQDAEAGHLPPWYVPEDSEGEFELLQQANGDAIRRLISSAFERVASWFPGYEERTAQINMADQALYAMLTGKPAVLEAGTGVGKSFAYLIAALSFAHLRGSRVLVTTETRNLQMQLFEKDLPRIQEMLDKDLVFDLALGSSNYLCRVRYEETFASGTFLDVASEEDVKIMKDFFRSVADGRTDGVQHEYTGSPRSSLWSLVNRDPDACPGSRCVHFSRCNYYRVKKRWESSRILAANHHLFLYHMLNDKRTLPPYGAVVVDEAHGMVETGYSIFTQAWSERMFENLRRLFTRSVRSHRSIPGEKGEEMQETFDSGIGAFSRFLLFAETELGLTFDADGTEILYPEKISEAPQNLFSSLVDDFKDIESVEEDSSVLGSISLLRKTLEKMDSFLNLFHSSALHERFVFWGEKRNESFTLKATNLFPGDEISRMLEEPPLFVSATLGYWGKEYLPQKKSELLLNGYFNNFMKNALPNHVKEDVVLDVFFSPFRYRENSVLYLPSHLEAPEYNAGASEREAYEEALFEEVKELAELSSGGALALFTSKALLERATDWLRESTDLEVISQIEEGPMRALQSFRDSKEGLLLGTASFWQGVDVPGDDLRMLIITKLMFTPPFDPVFQARSEWVKKKGGSPFSDLALPFAATMLRQAYGRLIRSERDKGVVAILDSRLLTRRYGKILLSNLPGTGVVNELTELKKLVQEKKLL